MHPANQRPRKPDKLSQGAHNQTSYPRVQWGNTLNKRGRFSASSENPEMLKPWRNPERLEVTGEHKVKEKEQEHRTTHTAGSEERGIRHRIYQRARKLSLMKVL